MQEESGFVTDSSLAENFHMAVLLNKGHFHARHLVHAIPGSLLAQVFFVWPSRAWWLLASSAGARPVVLLLHGRQRAHQQRVRQAEVRVHRLLLIRDLCVKLGAVIFTGDFNKAVERETPSGDGERRSSPLEAAFRHTNVPWLTFGLPRCGAQR